jgi:hypothetical protein
MTERPAVARLVPDRPMPPYSYVPGRGLPHPISSPLGHSFGSERAPADPLDPGRWHACPAYLFGFDLLNRGFFWEAHEAWEPLWHASGRSGAVADLLKGLIKLAAAGVKHLEGMPRGVSTHAGRAAEAWRAAAASPGVPDRFAGLEMRGAIVLAERIARDGWPEAPLVLLPGERGGPGVTP